MTNELTEAVARLLAGPRADELVEAGDHLGNPADYPAWMLEQPYARKIIAAVRAHDAANGYRLVKGEPVAWMYERNGVRKFTEKQTWEYTSPVMGFTETPLFAAINGGE